MTQDRRQFLRHCVLAAGTMLALEGQTPKRILIRPTANSTFRRRLAERELLRGLADCFRPPRCASPTRPRPIAT